ncbi:hypothetical protein [Kitasatospora camelliae]|uniref:Uncharacterized protein n=1 Tax=Kitasatospora camelliae TaxID=3156397 RepID=A0AAU8JQR0_9ACTN
MLGRRTRRDGAADAIADLVADARRLDYGRGYADHHLGSADPDRVPPQRDRRPHPHLSPVVERYYRYR